MKAKDEGGTSVAAAAPLLPSVVVAAGEVAVGAAAAALVFVAVVAVIGVANFLCLRMIFPKSWRGLGRALTVSRGSNSKFSPKVAL